MKSRISPGSSSRNIAIAAEFGRKAEQYDLHADLHSHIARKLNQFLPRLKSPRILEIGCGTGLLTVELAEKYPDSRIVVTDLSEIMLNQCRKKLPDRENIRFSVMDGENPDETGCFDLIATSMTLQWFKDPLMGIDRLRSLLSQEGQLLYATIAPDCFPEWRKILHEKGLPSGIPDMPELPGIIENEKIDIEFDHAIEFLQKIRSIGAHKPRDGYRPVSPAALRSALDAFEKKHRSKTSWRIVYGQITSRRS